jgi:hypothetical protein
LAFHYVHSITKSCSLEGFERWRETMTTTTRRQGTTLLVSDHPFSFTTLLIRGRFLKN